MINVVARTIQYLKESYKLKKLSNLQVDVILDSVNENSEDEETSDKGVSENETDLNEVEFLNVKDYVLFPTLEDFIKEVAYEEYPNNIRVQNFVISSSMGTQSVGVSHNKVVLCVSLYAPPEMLTWAIPVGEWLESSNGPISTEPETKQKVITDSEWITSAVSDVVERGCGKKVFVGGRRIIPMPLVTYLEGSTELFDIELRKVKG